MQSGGTTVPEFAEERAELESILSSRIFTRAPNMSRILAYVCERYFDGAADALKEYNIAVEALGRPPDFDPSADSIVRVEVCRLRKRLVQFYETEGQSHTIRLQLAESGYVPFFTRDGAESADANDPLLVDREVAAPDDEQIEPRQDRVARPSFSGRRVIWWVAAGVFTTVVLATVIWQSQTGAAAVSNGPALGAALAAALPDSEEIRIAVGSSVPKYVDGSGHLWLSDRYVTGGTTLSRPDRRIIRTSDPSLYRNAREGDFQYDIPLKPGTYELHLHFAEIVHGDSSMDSGGEGSRRFNVTANDVPLLQGFDIITSAAGPNVADEQVFRDIRPGPDGYLHLRFSAFMRKPLLSGIEVLPSKPGRVRPTRIVVGGKTYYDKNGNLWEADRYWQGGRVIRRVRAVSGTDEPELFANERWGHFSYAIPVPDGKYRLRLTFAESNFGVDNFEVLPNRAPGKQSRLFDVYCNGVALIRNLDIYAEAGGPDRAVEKVFTGLTPNAQGKLLLSFVPVRDYATVRAIEVVEME